MGGDYFDVAVENINNSIFGLFISNDGLSTINESAKKELIEY